MPNLFQLGVACWSERGYVHDASRTPHIAAVGQRAKAVEQTHVAVYPRTEAVLDGSAFDVSSERGRQRFGVVQLDAMLVGGLLTGTTTLVVGPAGSGKTLLGLHFLTAGAQAGAPGLYVGLIEPPPDLIAKAGKVGLELSRWVDTGQITLHWQPVITNSLDILAAQLIDVIVAQGVQRVFIDGIQGLQTLTAYPERLHRFLTALSNELRIQQVTTIYTIEIRAARRACTTSSGLPLAQVCM
jgi:circadian clock protein KaiC